MCINYTIKFKITRCNNNNYNIILKNEYDLENILNQ